MANRTDTNFTYLNREGRWLGNHWDGLEIGPSGALQLSTLPLFADGSESFAALPLPDGPAGIAVDPEGAIYFADAAGNRALRIDGCGGEPHPIPCIGGAGSGPAQFHTPRGLLYSKARGALFVADSGNDRIQVFNVGSGQLVEVWGRHGNQPGEFDMPWTIAAGTDGSIFVVDYGNHRVQKFNPLGDVQSSFWQTLEAAHVIAEPVDVAVGQAGAALCVYIVDRTTHCVFVTDADGNLLLDSNGHAIVFGSAELEQPLGIVVIGDSVYVGDNGLRQVLRFDAADGYRFRGAAVGYDGPVAGLAAGGMGGLLVHTGASLTPVELQLGQGYATQGVFWSGAIQAPAGKVTWHRLEAIAAGLAPDAHIELFFYASNGAADAPIAPALSPAGSTPFTDPRWHVGPTDASDLFIGGDPAIYLWVGAWFSGDGRATPTVTQMRVEFDHETYLADLPSIYRKPDACKDFLLRLLSLFETFNLEAEVAIERLPALFDPKAAPTNYLPWLAGWLALTLEEDWDEATSRHAIIDAFSRYAQRGTAIGLKAALKAYAGVDAIIQEPILNAAWWSLPAPATSPCASESDAGAPVTDWQSTENSILGYTTMLAAAEPQGAVVGTTAVLDQSHLITESEFGAPLFDDVAFQFCVHVYRGQVECAGTLPLVRAVIEQEKPAHTTYGLCVLEPEMRVGFQARVGVDAIVAGPPAAMRLGDTPGLGVETVLGGQPAGRIGSQSQLGVTTLVG